jgi:hypothetical protein
MLFRKKTELSKLFMGVNAFFMAFVFKANWEISVGSPFR